MTARDGQQRSLEGRQRNPGLQLPNLRQRRQNLEVHLQQNLHRDLLDSGLTLGPGVRPAQRTEGVNLDVVFLPGESDNCLFLFLFFPSFTFSLNHEFSETIVVLVQDAETDSELKQQQSVAVAQLLVVQFAVEQRVVALVQLFKRQQQRQR